METNKMKKFATEARSRLRAGVATKIRSLGFDADGNAVPSMVEKAREFDPFGHAGFDPSGIKRLTP